MAILLGVVLLAWVINVIVKWRPGLPALLERCHPVLRSIWSRELRALLVVVGVALLTGGVGYLLGYPAVGKGFLNVAVAGLFAITYGISLGTVEGALRRMVRSYEAAKLSQTALNLGLIMLLVEQLSHQDVTPPSLQAITPYVLTLLYFVGLNTCLKSVRLSFYQTHPIESEQLGSFVLAILKTVFHHLMVIFVLTWGYVNAISLQVRDSFTFPVDGPPHILLTATYALGKLTITYSGAMQPHSGAGHVIDAGLGLLGYGITVFAVTSFFALLQRLDINKP